MKRVLTFRLLQWYRCSDSAIFDFGTPLGADLTNNLRKQIVLDDVEERRIEIHVLPKGKHLPGSETWFYLGNVYF